jgi:hypothetical protein
LSASEVSFAFFAAGAAAYFLAGADLAGGAASFFGGACFLGGI